MHLTVKGERGRRKKKSGGGHGLDVRLERRGFLLDPFNHAQESATLSIGVGVFQ
jgi:hypothetical protein